MMGQLPAAQNELFYDFNIEQYIPANHLLRKIDQFLDFGQIRKHLKEFYSNTGRPSIDPELMIRILIVGYCYGIRSERRLCEEVMFNLAYRWFCRLGLEDNVPDHSTFSKNRLGRYRDSHIFRFVFETVVQRCMDEGLVKGEGFAVDGSIIQADVSRKNTARDSAPIDWGPAEQQSRAVKEYLESLDDNVQRTKPASISLTDPAARWTAAKGKAQFAYSTNYMIDVQCGVIVDVEATPANRIDEIDCTRAMLERIEDNYQVKPKRLMGDTAYGTAPMLDYLVEQKGIEPHIPVWERSVRTDGTFSLSDFIWQADNDCYECPAGKLLKPRHRSYKKLRPIIIRENMIRYRASIQDCKVCEYKLRCCPNTPVRKIDRNIYESSRDIARAINQTEQFKKQSAYERRKVEMAFAHMKRQLNFHRLRLRGLRSANDECILVATVQNLRKLTRVCSQSPPELVNAS